MPPSSRSTPRPISSRATRPSRRWLAGIAEAALGAKGDLDKLGKAKFPGGKDSVADTIKEMIGTIGENMTLRRTAYLDVKKGAVASYMHNQMAPGLGKIGVIVALESVG